MLLPCAFLRQGESIAQALAHALFSLHNLQWRPNPLFSGCCLCETSCELAKSSHNCLLLLLIYCACLRAQRQYQRVNRRLRPRRKPQGRNTYDAFLIVCVRASACDCVTGRLRLRLRVRVDSKHTDRVACFREPMRARQAQLNLHMCGVAQNGNVFRCDTRWIEIT